MRAEQLWSQSIDSPGTISLARVEKAVVQPAGPALPEFNFPGHDAVTAPKRRKRHLAFTKFALHLLPFLLQKSTAS